MDEKTACELEKIASHVRQLVVSVRILQEVVKAHDRDLQKLSTVQRDPARVRS